jgi:hypothetical protein
MYIYIHIYHVHLYIYTAIALKLSRAAVNQKLCGGPERMTIHSPKKFKILSTHRISQIGPYI